MTVGCFNRRFFVVVATEETICVEANEGSEEEHVEIFLACELL